MDKNKVNEVFEILLKEIEAVANTLNEEGAQALRTGDYAKARSSIEEATRLAKFREKVKKLQKEWFEHFSLTSRLRDEKGGGKSRAQLRPGLRTPEKAFRRPILETLVELGSSAPMGEVLSRVEQKMKDVLNEYDREPLPSHPWLARWQNTAQWCRKILVQEGLMKDNSPYGIWEISELGFRWLKSETNQ